MFYDLEKLNKIALFKGFTKQFQKLLVYHSCTTYSNYVNYIELIYVNKKNLSDIIPDYLYHIHVVTEDRH